TGCRGRSAWPSTARIRPSWRRRPPLTARTAQRPEAEPRISTTSTTSTPPTSTRTALRICTAAIWTASTSTSWTTRTTTMRTTTRTTTMTTRMMTTRMTRTAPARTSDLRAERSARRWAWAGSALVRQDEVDRADQLPDVVGLDGHEGRDAQLIAAELAVRLGVGDAVGAQSLRDGRGVHAVGVVRRVDGGWLA